MDLEQERSGFFMCSGFGFYRSSEPNQTDGIRRQWLKIIKKTFAVCSFFSFVKTHLVKRRKIIYHREWPRLFSISNSSLSFYIISGLVKVFWPIVSLESLLNVSAGHWKPTIVLARWWNGTAGANGYTRVQLPAWACLTIDGRASNFMRSADHVTQTFPNIARQTCD